MPEKENEMLSIAARQWLAEGRAEGRAEGEARGKAEGKAESLVRVLEKRFGSVPAVYLDAIAAAETGALEAWLDRAIDAESIEAVFAPSTH
jgi:flagellar biosynthesis/type III secretory pathway protein FliH